MSNSETQNKTLITLETPVDIYSSINYLPPYLQKQDLMQDLCFFIDYLGVDIETAYNDLRYKYIDWLKVSEAGAAQTLKGMGMDYIVDLIEVITPSNSSQLLALCSLIWLLKGQLLGVDIISSICGFSYTYTVWHEQVPLGTPNTAEIKIDFSNFRTLSEDFQHNFVEFLRKYLYPVINTHVVASPMEDKIMSYGFSTMKEITKFVEVMRYYGKPLRRDILANFDGTYFHCYHDELNNVIRISVDEVWYNDGQFWSTDGYYSEDGIWATDANTGAFYTEYEIWNTGRFFVYKVNPIIHYLSYLEEQTMRVFIRYSETGYYWTNWEEVTEDYNMFAFQYCQFRIAFNNTQGGQMVLYSFEVELT